MANRHGSSIPGLTTPNTQDYYGSGINQPYSYPYTGGVTWTDNTTTYTGYPSMGVDLEPVLERLDAIEHRLNIINKAPPDKVKALDEAYKHYKFLEKLCEGEDNGITEE